MPPDIHIHSVSFLFPEEKKENEVTQSIESHEVSVSL